MNVPASPIVPPPRIDANALQHQLQRLAAGPGAPWLHQEIARRMADKLEAIRLRPGIWIDWSAFLGGGAQAVQAHYPDAQRWVVEAHAALAPRSEQAQPRRWWQLRSAPIRVETDVRALPSAQAQLLWANMALHGVDDIAGVFTRWRESLAVGGMVMFSCFGPDTVRQLSALYRQDAATSAGAPATIAFLDMHDLGDALIHSGFAEPVMDMEHIALNWRDARSMLDELRTLGGNCAPHRFAGLRTPAWRAQLERAIEARLADASGRVSLTFEIIYGHAIVAATAHAQAETRISEQSLRQMLRRDKP